jgi:hypothetical protein
MSRASSKTILVTKLLKRMNRTRSQRDADDSRITTTEIVGAAAMTKMTETAGGAVAMTKMTETAGDAAAMTKMTETAGDAAAMTKMIEIGAIAIATTIDRRATASHPGKGKSKVAGPERPNRCKARRPSSSGY